MGGDHGGHNQVTLTVKSTSGTWPGARFNLQNRAQKVLDEAVRHFGLDPSPAQPYFLVRERDGATLNLAEKLSDLGLADGDVVIVQASQPVDG